MPEYDYMCRDCEHITTIVHKINETPDLECPKCGGETHKTYVNAKIQGYVKGNGIVNDVGGARRDMNLYKLQKEDPYAQHRVAGEKDYLENKFRRGGKAKDDLVATGTPRWAHRDGKMVPINTAAEEYDRKKKENKDK